jgi:hypothetical protein
MTKRAIILCMYADNDITSDLGWDGIEMYMVYDVLDDMWCVR